MSYVNAYEIPADFEMVMGPAETPWDIHMQQYNCSIIRNGDGEYFVYNPFFEMKYQEKMYKITSDFDFKMIVKARYYQFAAVVELKKNLRGYGNHAGIFKKYLRNLLVLPTGAGKTLTSLLVFADPDIREILTGSRDKKVKILFVAHRHRLLKQAVDTYEQSDWVEIRTMMASANCNAAAFEEAWDITIIDEAHHEAMKSIQVQLEFLIEKPILLLTATPIRKDGLMIKADKQISTLNREDAEKYGFLARAGVYSVIDYDLENKTTLVKRILEEFADTMGQTIIFTQYTKDVEALENFIRYLGFSAIGITGKMSEKETDNVLEAFSNKEVQFVINCTKLDEGIDVSGVETVLVGRNYNSYNQLNQVIGRVVRPDCPATVWQLVNPFKENLDATKIVHSPTFHRVYEYVNNAWEYDDLKAA